MEGKQNQWQQQKYRQQKYTPNPAHVKSKDAYFKLKEGLIKYLGEKGCIVTKCNIINPEKFKMDFNQLMNLYNKLTENTIKMNQQLVEKSEIDEYSIQDFKKDNEEILKEKEEILKEIEDSKEKLNMDKDDIFEKIFNAKRNQYANLDCLEDKDLSKINKWLKKNKLPIMSDDPDVENSIASIPIYNTSKRQNHTVRSFLDQLAAPQQRIIIYDNDEKSDVLKIKINSFKATEHYSQNSRQPYQPKKQEEKLDIPDSESDSDSE